MHVVTIWGLLGTGAPEIGRAVADKLQVRYIDRELIATVASRLHRKETDITAKELLPGSLGGYVLRNLEISFAFGDNLSGNYLNEGKLPLQDAIYLNALESAVREMVQSDSAVMVGRGSQFILRDYERALHVLAVAPFEVRVDRVMQDLKCNQKAARMRIDQNDRILRGFFKRYFKVQPEDTVHYGLVVNTGIFDFHTAGSIIVEALHVKGKMITIQDLEQPRIRKVR